MAGNTTHPKKNTLAPLKTLLIAAASLMFSVALFLYAYLGYFSRYYADDYCLTSSLLRSGFWKTELGLYLSWSDRFADLPLVGLSELFGRMAVQAWPGVTIVLWVLALWWLFVQAGRLTRLPATRSLALLAALVLVFFTLVEAPQLYQSLYWRIGLITYTLPLVFLAILIGLILQCARSVAPGRLPLWAAALCLLIAFFAGGLSETYVVLQTAVLFVAEAVLLLGGRSPARRPWLILLTSALAGSVLALVVVVLAPGNTIRLSAVGTGRPPLPHLIRMTVTNAFLFILISLKTYSVENLLALLLPALLAYSLFAGEGDLLKLRPSSLVWSLLLTPLVAVLLIMAICAPSAYGESSYPDGRVLIEAAFILVTALVAEGALAGMGLSQLHRWADEPAPRSLQALAALLFLLMALYPLYNAHKTVALVPIYRAHAASWDAHAAQIASSLKDGVARINLLDSQARSFDTLSGLQEIGSDPKAWVNVCAAEFFGARSLAINQPNP
jgi:hypothetical protein